MSLDSISIFSDDEFIFFTPKPELSEKKWKNTININLFNKKIYQNTHLNGYLKIIIPEKLEEGSFYINLIGEEKKNFDLYKNNEHLIKLEKIKNKIEIKNKYFIDSNKIKSKENGILKTNCKSKIAPIIINSVDFRRKKNIDFSDIFNNESNNLRSNIMLNNKILSKKMKMKKSISENQIFKNDKLYDNVKKCIEKETKLFTVKEDILNKSFLIWPFSLFITNEFYPTINLKFSNIEYDYENLINKFESSNKNSDEISQNSILLDSKKFEINLNYTMKIYYLTEKAYIDTKDLNENEKLKKFEEFKISNNYFECSTPISILKDVQNLEKNYEKKLSFINNITKIKFNILCIKFHKNYKIKIDINKNIFNKKESNLDIIFFFDKQILNYYKYLDIIIISKFQNKIENKFEENILYISSNLLTNDCTSKNKLNQFIKTIKLKNISNKVQSFDTYEESNSYYVLFYLSKYSLNFEKIIEKIPIYYNNYNFDNDIKTYQQIVNFYKKLDILLKKKKIYNDVIILPFSSIKDMKDCKIN